MRFNFGDFPCIMGNVFSKQLMNSPLLPAPALQCFPGQSDPRGVDPSVSPTESLEEVAVLCKQDCVEAEVPLWAVWNVHEKGPYKSSSQMDHSGVDSGDYSPFPQILRRRPFEGGQDEGELKGSDICCTFSSPLNLVSSFCRHFTIQMLKGNFKSHAILLDLIFFLSPF